MTMPANADRPAVPPPAVPSWLADLGRHGVHAALVGWPAAMAALGRPLAEPAPNWIVEHLPEITPMRVMLAADAPSALAPLPAWVAAERLPSGGGFVELLAGKLAQMPWRSLAVALLADGTVVDPFGALPDWQDGVLRCGGDPRNLWRPDFAGALGVAAIAAWTGAVPDRAIVRALQRDAICVLQVPRQTWHAGFAAVLLGPKASVGLQFLLQSGLLPLMVPEAAALFDFHKSCPVHHKDIWDHTLQVIEKCPQHLVVRWAALMHDTGKVATRSVQKGRVHFFGHEALGASLMEGVAGRFHMPADIADRIVYVIGHHARANAYLHNWTDSAVRRLVREMGDHLDDVLTFSRSDYTTKRSGRIAEVQSLTARLAERIPEIIEADAKIPPLPKGLGTHIMAQTGLQPGPWLGRIQKWLEEQCDAGLLHAHEEPDYYLQAVRDQAADLLQVQPGSERQRLR